MADFGDYLQERRRARGLTQGELARQAGIPQPNLSNIERGKQDITVMTLRRLAHALDFSLSGFFRDLESREKGRPDIVLGRERLERLASRIVCGKPVLNKEDEAIAQLFLQILPQAPRARVSALRTQRAWIRLRRKLSSEAIRTLSERVRDAEARSRRAS